VEDDVMAVGKTLTIFLNADLKKFNSGMAQAQGGLKGFAAGMKNLLGPAAIGAGVAIAGLATKMAVDGVNAAMANEESLVKLTNTLENLGLAHNTEAIEDYIYQLERSLGVADTELRPAYQKLVVATGDVGKANDALALALDVSAASGKSLEQVTEALSKAFSGQIAGLSRLNLGIDAATIKSGDMDLILQKLSSTTAGAATASADTLTGRMKVLQTAVDNLGEAFGQGLVNSLKKGTDGTSAAVKDMEKFEEGLTDVGESIGDTGFAIAGFVIQANKINTAVNDAAKGNNIFSKALDKALTVLNPVSLVTESLGGAMSFLSGETDVAADSVRNISKAAGATADRMIGLAASINATTIATGELNEATGAGPAYKNSGVNPYAEYLRLQRIGVLTLPTLTEKTEDQTTATNSGSSAVDQLTKKQQKLIDKYKEGEIALTTRGQQLLEEVTALDAARTAITDYTSALSENILSGVNLGTAYEAQFNAEGQKTGASLLDGFNQQIAQAEYFGEVLNQIKAQGADQSLIEQIASLGPETGAALAQQMIDEGLVATLSDKWVSVNETVNELAKGLIPEGLLAGEQFALATVQGTAATLLKEQKSLKKLGKQVGKIVGASFKAQLADDVAEAVRNVEAQGTAARAEAVAQAERQQVNLTNQAVAQALQNLLRGADARNGAPIAPLLS
jgi:hypothetical protein